ncbi:MAG: 3-deoxy-D-manno-octulosonic acid transferase [Rikenellaceae bacterium]|nr:3-deoxy-D-manno-octulosonic acid transferase [Rikenellaceae bacterium]
MRLAARFNKKADQRKAGLKDIFKRMAATIDRSAPLVWVHAASLGEFEQGRPVIEAIRAEHPGYKIMLTFFSPSGYEVRKNYTGADYVFYLPIDTPYNARRFVQIARPEIAIFIKYEFWLNYLRQLSKAKCRIFLVSAIFRDEQIFFKWWAGTFRKGLRLFEWLFVQNMASRLLLDTIGIHNTTATGDTRFDRVAAVAGAARRIQAVEKFAAGARVMVAGSTWPPDEHIIMEMVRRHPELKFVIVPHEIVEERIEGMITRSARPVVRYTECDGGKDPSGYEVMIVDVIGILSSVYQYASYAYIGGGFGVGIHNTLEAAAFGIPVAFGPNYHRFREACDLIATGAGVSVESADELDEWLTQMEQDRPQYEDRCELSRCYVSQNMGATRKILEHIFPVG